MPVDYFTAPAMVLDFWLRDMHASNSNNTQSFAFIETVFFSVGEALVRGEAEVMIRVIIVCLDENCNVFVCLASNDSPVVQALLPGNCICHYAI